MPKRKGKNPDKMCQLIFWNTHNKRSDGTRILYIFTEDVKLYSTSHLKLHKIHECKSLLMKEFQNEVICLSSISGSIVMCILKF